MKVESSETTILTGNESDEVAKRRCALLTDFKERGRKLRIRITDKMVAKAANPKWNDRTMVAWWKRNDVRCTLPHDKKIRAVLDRDDPASIWSPKTKEK